jgi:dolichol-phosphate mannosyltransferase
VGELTQTLSIVLPAWNEEGVVGELVEELDRKVAVPLGSAEIVVVDDGSTDRTAEVLAAAAADNERLRVVTQANRGHGPAVLAALALARGDWIFQLDSDGQFAVADFWKLWERRDGADLVLGVRAERQDPAHRLVLSRVVAVVVSILAGRRIRDPNVPFRLIRRALWDDVAPLIGRDALAPSILTVVAAVVREWRVVDVPVHHRAREDGTSSLRALRLLRFSLRGLGQLIRFRVALARTPRRAA